MELFTRVAQVIYIIIVVELALSTKSIASIEPEAYINGDYLIVVKDGSARRFYLPNELQKPEDFQIIIDQESSPPDSSKNQNASNRGQSDNDQSSDQREHQIDVSKLIVKAKSLYQSGKVQKSMEALNAAEEQSPNNATIKSMKGSLLYYQGQVEDARRYWQDSLAISPNQDDIKRFLKSTERLTNAEPPRSNKQKETL